MARSPLSSTAEMHGHVHLSGIAIAKVGPEKLPPKPADPPAQGMVSWFKSAWLKKNQRIFNTFHHFSPNSFSYRGSYFKLGGEGSQVLWIRCGGCHAGCRWRCNLLRCVWVWVRRSKTGLSSHRVSLTLSSDACN